MKARVLSLFMAAALAVGMLASPASAAVITRARLSSPRGVTATAGMTELHRGRTGGQRWLQAYGIVWARNTGSVKVYLTCTVKIFVNGYLVSALQTSLVVPPRRANSAQWGLESKDSPVSFRFLREDAVALKGLRHSAVTSACSG